MGWHRVLPSFHPGWMASDNGVWKWQKLTFTPHSLASTNPAQTCDPLPGDAGRQISELLSAVAADNHWRLPTSLIMCSKNTTFGTKRTANYAQILILIFQFIIISSSCPNRLSKQLISQYLHLPSSCSSCWTDVGTSRKVCRDEMVINLIMRKALDTSVPSCVQACSLLIHSPNKKAKGSLVLPP